MTSISFLSMSPLPSQLLGPAHYSDEFLLTSYAFADTNQILESFEVPGERHKGVNICGTMLTSYILLTR